MSLDGLFELGFNALRDTHGKSTAIQRCSILVDHENVIIDFNGVDIGWIEDEIDAVEQSTDREFRYALGNAEKMDDREFMVLAGHGLEEGHDVFIDSGVHSTVRKIEARPLRQMDRVTVRSYQQ